MEWESTDRAAICALHPALVAQCVNNCQQSYIVAVTSLLPPRHILELKLDNGHT